MTEDQSANRRIFDAGILLSILDHLPASIFVKDEDLRFVYSNAAHCRMVGHDEDMLLGQSDADFYPASEAQEFTARDRQVLESGLTSECEETVTGVSGLSALMLTRKTRLVTPGGTRYLIGTNTDLTEIRKREEQYRALAETVPVGVWQVDENMQTGFANPRFNESLGLENGILQGADIAAILGIHRKDFPGKVEQFETDIQLAGGESRRLLVISSGWLTLSAEALRSAIVSVVDISEMTELKRINDEISRLNTELAANMNKLREAQDEVLRRGRMAQLGQLTATVAHEIRNPLGAVRTAAFLIERRVKDKGLDIDKQLRRIGNGVTRCDTIISQLLDFSRSRDLQTEPTVIDDWLARIVGEEAEKLPQIVTIECEFGLDGISADVDVARLQRVVVNLLSNASEAMVGKGGTPETPAVQNPMINIFTRMGQRGVEIVISDNGPGMSEEVLAKILEPLFTTKTFGTGLGLPAVEKILQDHRGGLDVTSAPGQGATFIAWFPLTQKQSAAA